MKLLYVIHQYFPDCFSGTEQYCLATAREARRRGDDVVVLSLVPDFGWEDPPILVHDQPYDGTPVRRLRHWGPLQPNEVLRDYENPLVAARFAQVVREVAPDAVHFFHLRNLGSDLIAAARDTGVRTVVNLMDYWFLCPRFTLLRGDGTLCEGPPDRGRGCIPCMHPELAGAWTDADAAEAATDFAAAVDGPLPGAGRVAQFAALIRRKPALLERLAQADAVIAPSRFLAAMFARNGFAAERMRVVPYGLEPGRVQRQPVARPRDPLRVGFAGVMSPWKAPHLLVEAVRSTELPLVVQLWGRTEEPLFADYIAPMRARAAGDPRIEFPGPFDREQLSDVLAGLDLLVVPSIWYENTPFVILEAMEAGVPVVASDLGGMAELVIDGQNGFLFESGNAAALATVLRRCATNPDAVASLDPRPAAGIAANYDAFLSAYRDSS